MGLRAPTHLLLLQQPSPVASASLQPASRQAASEQTQQQHLLSYLVSPDWTTSPGQQALRLALPCIFDAIRAHCIQANSPLCATMRCRRDSDALQCLCRQGQGVQQLTSRRGQRDFVHCACCSKKKKKRYIYIYIYICIHIYIYRERERFP